MIIGLNKMANLLQFKIPFYLFSSFFNRCNKIESGVKD